MLFSFKADKVSGVVINVCEHDDGAITVDGDGACDRFMGKGSAHTSILAPGDIAVQVKAD